MPTLLLRCPECFIDTSGQFPCQGCGHQPQETPLRALSPLTALPSSDQVRYRLGRVLGQGGFGITYLAWDEALRLRVAIKEYYPRQSVGRSMEDRCTLTPYSAEDHAAFAAGLHAFLREARLLADCQHPHIIHLRDFFEANGTAYLVMDYHPGHTLKEAVVQRGRWPWPEAVALLRPLLAALHTLHQRQILHRDIKPENIYLADNGTPLLMDFGAARQAVGKHTHTLTVVLTPGYAAQEQYISGSQEQGPWTDVYGAAATLYYTLTGQAPLEAPARLGKDGLQPLRKIQPQLNPIVPHALEAMVNKALAVTSQKRFQSAEAFAQQLATLAPTSQSFSISARHWGLPLASGVAAAALGAVIMMLLPPPQKNPSSVQPPSSPGPVVPLKPTVEPQKNPEPSLAEKKAKYLKELFEAANNGDARSQVEVGWMYTTGQGVNRDDSVAVNWFREAAKRNNPVGGIALSVVYSLGKGTAKNSEESAKWLEISLKQTPDFFSYPELVNKLKKTAEAGDILSQMTLGQAYFYVNPANYPEAAQWYRKVAEQGNADAQNKLGWMYANGLGVPKDDQKAVEWYQKSEKQENSCAKILLGGMYLFGRGIEKNYEKGIQLFMLINKDQYKSDSCQNSPMLKEAKIDNNDIWSQFIIGLVYELILKKDEKATYWLNAVVNKKGIDTELYMYLADFYSRLLDIPKAAQWHYRAAHQGHIGAKYKLGRLYLKGLGVDKDIEKALNFLKSAAEKGHAAAQNDLGFLYQQENNKAEARKWYEESAKQNYTEAIFNLGLLYLENLDQSSKKQAIELFEEADRKGFINATIRLGHIYYQGEIVHRDLKKAKSFFNRAANQDSDSSQYSLGIIYFEEKNFTESYFWLKIASENPLFASSANKNLVLEYLKHASNKINSKKILEIENDIKKWKADLKERQPWKNGHS